MTISEPIQNNSFNENDEGVKTRGIRYTEKNFHGERSYEFLTHGLIISRFMDDEYAIIVFGPSLNSNEQRKVYNLTDLSAELTEEQIRQFQIKSITELMLGLEALTYFVKSFPKSDLAQTKFFLGETNKIMADFLRKQVDEEVVFFEDSTDEYHVTLQMEHLIKFYEKFKQKYPKFAESIHRSING